MIGKVKRWFGIEGVKIELIIPEEINEKSGKIHGKIRFSTMETQIVTALQVKIVETYKRGRKEDKRIDDYQIGRIYLEEEMEIQPEEPLELDFSLPFELVKSEIDAFGDKNFLAKGIASLAKRSRAVKSTFRVEAEANVKGTKLNPFDKQVITIV
jgi:sporulation-control protein spo0M